MTQPDFAARNQVDSLLRERNEVLTMRWLGATAGIGGCAVLLALLSNTIPEPVPGIVVVVAWLLGGGLALASVLVPRRQLADKLLAARMRVPIDAYRWAVQMKLSSAQKDAFIALPPQEQSVIGLTLMFERPYNLGLALAFGVAFVGFAYGLLSRTLLEAAPFLLGALVLNCWHYPRLAKLVERGRAVQTGDQEQDALRAIEEIEQVQQHRPSQHPPPKDAALRPGPQSKDAAARQSQPPPPKDAAPRTGPQSKEAAPRPQRKSRAGERPPGTQKS